MNEVMHAPRAGSLGGRWWWKGMGGQALSGAKVEAECGAGELDWKRWESGTGRTVERRSA